MGVCNSVKSKPDMSGLTAHDVKAHKTIEKGMNAHLKKDLQLKKLLLLGAGSSGKSTLFRQLKFVYNKVLPDNEKEESTAVIRRNCVSGILILLKKSQQLYEMDNKENLDCYVDLNEVEDETKDNDNNNNSEYIASVKRQNLLLIAIQNVVNYHKETFDGYEHDPQIREYAMKNDNDNTIDDYIEKKIIKKTDELYQLAVDIDYLWKQNEIQSTFKKRRIYQYSFPDNMDYFFNQLNILFAWNYTPTKEDIIKCRIRTTGLIEDKHETKDSSFTITDVGGQRNERRKWIHGFEGVTAVIFVAALNHFAAVLFEDESKNAMMESIELFYEICNSKWFKLTEMILFLNKDDLFQECIQKDCALVTCFSEKNGAIWKKEYVDDENYLSQKPKIHLKEDNNNNRARSLSTDPMIKQSDKDNKNKQSDNKDNKINNHNNNNIRKSDNLNLNGAHQHRVHNESESISYSHQNQLSPEEYQRRPAIYPKQNLRISAKNSYSNASFSEYTDDEWFKYIYVDYLNFITEQYDSMNKSRGKDKPKRVYKHVTTATDGDNVKKVFWDVQNIVVRGNLRTGGLM